jgi:hypothetical protein
MVKIVEVKLEKDAYNGIDFKKQMKPLTTANIKLSDTNHPFRKDIPAGKSARTGKDYKSFTVYSLKCEYNGEPVYLKWSGSEGLANDFETYSVGDVVEIACFEHPKGKTFSLSLVEN